MIHRSLGRVDYESTVQQMRTFTDGRTADTPDELWIVEHDPVFTQGVAGKPEHLLFNPANIPVVKTDRGGQITYHGPGQTVVYILFDIRRAGFGVRELVQRIEDAVIQTLANYGVEAYGKRDAPGVYVKLEPLARRRERDWGEGNKPIEAKIASLGLKIRNGCSYHGVALNVRMDLTPFSFINPCGYEGLQVTQLSDFATEESLEAAGFLLAAALEATLTAPITPKP
ncbi:MAG: lipoyl(octanoyl) transferase LipB [Betaproteobacteria bacterium]|nr:MAG: lipoyl(octanoyl) transferase LipB [Betaproteobacteria bacterium]